MAIKNFIAIYDMNFLDSPAPTPCEMAPISRLPTDRGHQPTDREEVQDTAPEENPDNSPGEEWMHMACPEKQGICCQPFFPILAGHTYFQ
jgi:hypothetical protein